MSASAVVKSIACAVALCAAGCSPVSVPQRPAYQPLFGQAPADAMGRLAADLGSATPDAAVVAVPGSAACGRAGGSVVRDVLPERVLFATASDEPAPEGGGVLDLLADRIRRDAPGADVTVLGHTDSVGSEAYNMDLSRRRALTVLRALVVRGLDPDHLSAVAIGPWQPVASNDTVEGRARNRRVEFLISDCLAANLGVVRAQGSPAANAPVAVMRLDPSSGYGMANIGTVSLRQTTDEAPVPAAVAPVETGPSPALKPPPSVARPAPAPHYQPHTLSPDAQPNPLGPAVPF